MKFIYIKNYLNISREKKFEFIKFIYSFEEFKLINQKIVLNDNALIIELSKNSSFDIAKTLIDKFFEDYDDIETFFIDSLAIEEDNTLILKRDNEVVRSVYIK
ncbi:hypothetical protein CRV01_00065 [Arcobacter sp. CECT 8983]|uniref:hypothetical protein n=1 Tax=Arcobacter sp. CECT 8983 TaxID=2044508 RepID=UPI00100BDF8D|nr:hypothetical protein [Arcobacter sp. CECT 8983]RXJ91522.1 hypothetical protein CRV01_00065 [Arcobacter sp. CECT 8983]